MPFISGISWAKQNREINGREYQLQAKIGRNYYSISNCMALIRQNKGAKIILHAKSPIFWAAIFKGFYSNHWNSVIMALEKKGKKERKSIYIALF